MIVATGTAHRQTQKRPTDDIDLLVHHIHHQLGLILLGQHLGTQHQKARGHPPIKHLGFGDSLPVEKVSRQLLLKELVVGLVGIERPDHPVAVAPSIGHHLVFVLAVRVGIAGQIQPPAPPPFTVGGRNQIPVHHALECFRRFIRKEGVHLAGRGRKACEIPSDSPNQEALLGFGSAVQPLRDQGRIDEPIYRML